MQFNLWVVFFFEWVLLLINKTKAFLIQLKDGLTDNQLDYQNNL